MWRNVRAVALNGTLQFLVIYRSGALPILFWLRNKVIEVRFEILE